MDMIELRGAHTADLHADAKAAVRHLLHDWRALRTGYVEGVAVRADRRCRGHSAVIMAALERVVRSAYQLIALGASAEGSCLYVARG
jgi:aminoglycoside 2'-N-acetyltransferase I